MYDNSPNKEPQQKPWVFEARDTEVTEGVRGLILARTAAFGASAPKATEPQLAIEERDMTAYMNRAAQPEAASNPAPAASENPLFRTNTSAETTPQTEDSEVTDIDELRRRIQAMPDTEIRNDFSEAA